MVVSHFCSHKVWNLFNDDDEYCGQALLFDVDKVSVMDHHNVDFYA